MQSYQTVLSRGEAEYVEKRSRFLSVAYPVSSEEEAIALLNERRAAFWDATHNVYAYSLRAGNTRRYSDDAEPQGTAGMPTLDVLLKSDVQDILVVTTRYFGGVLLGTGGLVRAYSHAAKLALDAAEIITMAPVTVCRVMCDYFLFGKMDALVASFDATERENDFADRVEMTFAVRTERVPALRAAMTDATAGQVALTTLHEKMAPVK